MDDVKLAVHMQMEKSFTAPPPRDVRFGVAHCSTNFIPQKFTASSIYNLSFPLYVLNLHISHILETELVCTLCLYFQSIYILVEIFNIHDNEWWSQSSVVRALTAAVRDGTHTQCQSIASHQGKSVWHPPPPWPLLPLCLQLQNKTTTQGTVQCLGGFCFIYFFVIIIVVIFIIIITLT